MKSTIHTTMKLSDALRELGHPVAYYPTLGKVFGMQESIFLAQFVYWTGKGSDPDGWIYKSASEIEEETGLTYEQQQRVRKVLGGSERFGTRGVRVKRIHFEPIIEERYERTSHRMYFRVNMPALDRAFSENLFSQLRSGAVGYYPTAHLGNTQQSIWVKPSSSIQRLHTKTTSKEVVQPGAHKAFLEFFDEMGVKVRRARPTGDKAGYRNLKIALQTTDESTLERLVLYFLADPKFAKYELDLKVFLSAGVMKALADQKNRDGFVKRMDGYADRYLGRIGAAQLRGTMTSDTEVWDERSFATIIGSLAEKFAIKK